VGVPATRRADETAALVRRFGGSPIVAATFEEVAVEDEEPLRRATEEVIGTLLTHSVHLTGVGTNRWFARAAAWGRRDALLDALRRAQVVARGPKSSAALKAHGIEPAWIPQSETSHEIAQRLLEEVGPKSVVSVQRHGEPVPELVDALLAAGSRVIEIAPYTWAPAADRGAAVRLVRALVSGEAQALLVTSAPQAHFLFVVADEVGVAEELRAALRQRVFTAAVGQVAAGGLGDEGVTADLIAKVGRVGHLVRDLAAARERVLEKAAGR
jgi:uroporphyrinogen-III synthase